MKSERVNGYAKFVVGRNVERAMMFGVPLKKMNYQGKVTETKGAKGQRSVYTAKMIKKLKKERKNKS